MSRVRLAAARAAAPKQARSRAATTLRFVAPSIAVAAAVVAAIVAFDGRTPPPAPPSVALGFGYSGSAACRTCHDDRHASWSKTYHRTMTQTPDAALGRFDGVPVPYAGGAARPLREGARLFVSIEPDVGAPRRAEVALLSGSHRYQQLFERVERGEGAAFVRLPIAWSIVDDRWLPITALFLDPDGVPPSTHASEWNSNCVFCHATGPRPGLLSNPADVLSGNASFQTTVAELGVACEACHGPGEAHVAAMADPAERARAEREGDPLRVATPTSLAHDRAVDACAQCHGQRLPHPPERAASWLRDGPTFRPGDALDAHATLLSRSTPPPPGADPGLFERRFYADGTPRLTAYEAQGLAASRCHVVGGATCTTCHAMHAGEPEHQLRPGFEGDASCASCHTPGRYATKTHTGHDGGPGSSCVACHMPRVVFGVLDARRSHRIDVPDVARDVDNGRPNACALCHLDRTPAELAAAYAKVVGRDAAPPARRGDRAPLDVADGVATAFAGDPLARLVLIRAFGDAPDGVGGALTRDPSDTKAFEISRRAVLAAAHGDAYAAIRIVARRSALKLNPSVAPHFAEAFRDVDPLATPKRRGEDLSRLLSALRRDCGSSFHDLFAPTRAPPFGFDATGRPDLRPLAALALLAPDDPIRIGE